MDKVNRCLDAVCDSVMKGYEESKDNTEDQEEIIVDIQTLRGMLGPEEKVLLNRLLDRINCSDSRYSYQAFREGVLFGLSLTAAER